jgi:hypothetical protein
MFSHCGIRPRPVPDRSADEQLSTAVFFAGRDLLSFAGL